MENHFKFSLRIEKFTIGFITSIAVSDTLIYTIHNYSAIRQTHTTKDRNWIKLSWVELRKKEGYKMMSRCITIIVIRFCTKRTDVDELNIILPSLCSHSVGYCVHTALRLIHIQHK